MLIAGAGIGGLALAIALARRGIGSRILEQRREFAEAGAGIQLGPNAVGVIRRLGVAAHLEPCAERPECLHVFEGRSGTRLAEMPLGEWIAQRHGAPYWVAHRADLHAALLKTAAALRPIEIIPGFEVASFGSDGEGAMACSPEGEAHAGALLVGADGLWSSVRTGLWPGWALPYSGKTAARALVERARAPAGFAAPSTGVWLSPAGHVVHYLVRDGREIAVVVILAQEWPGVGWGIPTDRDSLLRRLGSFAPRLRDFLALAADWRSWPLYDPTPLPRWSQGRVTLLGDAAHPVLPFLAQGGGLALEDAETLAAALQISPTDPAGAIARYEQIRRPRAERMQRASRRNGLIYHLRGPAGLARNFALRLLPGHRLMAHYDWVYGRRPELS